MEPNGLYNELEKYFPKHLDLMYYLKVGACWEYLITENSTDDENTKLHYYLYKESDDKLIMTKEKPDLKPDLILYFTENAILQLIQGDPTAEEYYERYHDVMDNPKPGIEIDNKVNKARLRLWRIGYKKWQQVYKF